MRYTHFHGTTLERGNLHLIDYRKKPDKADLEKQLGMMISKIEYTSGGVILGNLVTIHLFSGKKLYIDQYRPCVFIGEHGSILDAPSDLPQCSTDPRKTYQVLLYLNDDKPKAMRLPFTTEAFGEAILTDIQEGRGVRYTTDRGHEAVIPHHTIRKASVVPAPYGG